MRRQTFSMGIDPITRSTPERVELADGTTAWVVDTGPDDGLPVLFVGGSATSATVVDLVSFLSSAREELGIRLISVERNGFGDTPFDPDGDYDDFARTAIGVLDAKGVDDFSIVAISGGGPYAQRVAASVPDRLRSVHFAAAYTGTPDAGPPKDLCRLEPQSRAALAQGYSDDPASWWAFGDDAIAHRIPGFLTPPWLTRNVPSATPGRWPTSSTCSATRPTSTSRWSTRRRSSTTARRTPRRRCRSRTGTRSGSRTWSPTVGT